MVDVGKMIEPMVIFGVISQVPDDPGYKKIN